MTRIEVPNTSSRRRSGGGFLRGLLTLLVIAVLGVALWTWLALNWSYSDGERAGVLQKFSHKGWLCKTYEGELALYIVSGIQPQVWYFTVRNPQTAAEVEKAVGHRVQLHYTEHPGVLFACFGDTHYYVDQVNIVDNAGPPAAPVVPAPIAPNPTPQQPPAAGLTGR
jgi:hypothetical protein